MKISAIIAEYNPFHSGHAYHINQTRKNAQDKIIVIMSGNFVQRGEPALFDKWVRTRMALHGGADMVLELPVHSALSSSQDFARGAIAVLEGLRCVDTLSFGAETADLTLLNEIASVLETQPADYRQFLTGYLQSGYSYPKAQHSAITHIMGPLYGDILAQPNNILAIEYLRALHFWNSHIHPCAITRYSDYRATELQPQFASAMAIRADMIRGSNQWQQYIDPKILSLYQHPIREDALFQALLYCLRSLSSHALSQIRDVREGFENRLSRAAYQASSYTELLQLCKSKRFTMARIKRILLNALLGITCSLSNEIQQAPFYARVLGIRKESLSLLSLCAKHSQIPVYTQLPRQTTHPSILLDIRASDLYALASQPVTPGGQDYTQPLIVL